MILGHHRIAAAASPRPPQVPCIADFVGIIPLAYGFAPGTVLNFRFKNRVDTVFATLHGNSFEFDCHDTIFALPVIDFDIVLELLDQDFAVYHDDPDDRRHDDDETTSTTTTTTTPRPTRRRTTTTTTTRHAPRDRPRRSQSQWPKEEDSRPATSRECRWKSSPNRSHLVGNHT